MNFSEFVPYIRNKPLNLPGFILVRDQDSLQIRDVGAMFSAMLMAAVLLSVIPIEVDADYEAGKREWDAGRPAEALVQWQAAAGAGDRRAMLELGRMYRRGLGVVQDFIVAHMWLNLAAGRGDIEAYEEREALASNMTAEQLAEAQDMAREWKPASSDVAEESTDTGADSEPVAESEQVVVIEPVVESEPNAEPDMESEPMLVESGAPPEAIQEAQTLLAALGYDPGDANGEWNVRSLEAYKEFLRDTGLPQADDLTPQMLIALRDTVRDHGVEVDSPTSESKADSLIQAVQAGDIDGTKAALDAGADVNEADSAGMTALMYAAKNGDAEMIESLLQVPSVDIDASAQQGVTALFIATILGHSEVIGQLMEAGANISVVGPDGNTAVDIARARYGELDDLDIEKGESAVRALLQGMTLAEYEKVSAQQAKIEEEQEALRQLQAEQEKLRMEQEKLKAERERLRLEQEKLAEQKAEQERQNQLQAEREREEAEQRRLAQEKAEEEAEQERVRLLLAEQERLRKQKAERENLRRLYPAGREFRDCDSCPVMVVVPAGTFTMGSPATEKSRNGSEGPLHEVTFSEAFAAGKFEVTFNQWEACVAEGGCSHVPNNAGWGRGKRPVINVNWHDASEYVDWLSQKTGKRYRLLSEAEWEYAARAGTTGPFHFGRRISTDQANYKGFYTYGGGSVGTYRARTVPVGSFPANAFGLHEVHGNVWEWTEDCWHGDYNGAPSDGSAWISDGDCNVRVIRGGSQGSRPKDLRSAVRSGNVVDNRNKSNGFRVGWTIAP